MEFLTHKLFDILGREPFPQCLIDHPFILLRVWRQLPKFVQDILVNPNRLPFLSGFEALTASVRRMRPRICLIIEFFLAAHTHRACFRLMP